MSASTIFSIFLTAVLFAGSFIAGEIALRELNPVTTTVARFVVATLFLYVLAAVTKTRLSVRPRHWPTLVLLGALGIAGYHYFFFSALLHTATANTAILNATAPVVTACLAAMLLRERLSRRNYQGVLFTTAGVAALILVQQGYSLQTPNRGDALMGVAVLCWSLYALLVKRLSRDYSPLVLSFHASWLGAGFLAALRPSALQLELIPQVSRDGWLAILYMGAAASGVGYWLYNVSVRNAGPTRTAAFVYGLVPPIVALLARLILGEPVTTGMALSAGLVFLGLRFVVSDRQAASGSPRP